MKLSSIPLFSMHGAPPASSIIIIIMIILVSGNRTAKELIDCMQDRIKCEKVIKDDVDETLCYVVCAIDVLKIIANLKDILTNILINILINDMLSRVAMAIMMINNFHRTHQK